MKQKVPRRAQARSQVFKVNYTNGIMSGSYGFRVKTEAEARAKFSKRFPSLRGSVVTVTEEAP